MQFLLTTALVLGTACPVFAQGKTAGPAAQSAPKQKPKTESSDLQKKLDDKLKEPFLKKAPWLTDYDRALADAKKSGKLIFGYFSRSYAY